MLNVLSVSDVSVMKNGYIILNNLSFDIKQGTFVSIVGSNGSGKTTLVRLLAGLEKYSGYVNINGYNLDDESRKDVISGVSIVFDNMSYKYLGITVWDNLVMGLVNLGKSNSYIKKKVNEICKLFDIDKKYLNMNINLLNKELKQVIQIAASVITEPSLLILDDCMNQITSSKKQVIINILNKLKRDKKMSIIMLTHNINDVLQVDKLLIMDEGSIVMEGTVKSIMKQGDKLLKYGLQLPFVVLLSLELIKREKISNIYYDERKLVDILWK